MESLREWKVSERWLVREGAYWRAGFIREKGILERGKYKRRGHLRERKVLERWLGREGAYWRAGFIREKGILERGKY